MYLGIDNIIRIVISISLHINFQKIDRIIKRMHKHFQTTYIIQVHLRPIC